jgi:hypothetical protein
MHFVAGSVKIQNNFFWRALVRFDKTSTSKELRADSAFTLFWQRPKAEALALPTSHPQPFARPGHGVELHGHCGLGSRIFCHSCISLSFLYFSVIPAQAGILGFKYLDSRLRGNDKQRAGRKDKQKTEGQARATLGSRRLIRSPDKYPTAVASDGWAAENSLPCISLSSLYFSIILVFFCHSRAGGHLGI